MELPIYKIKIKHIKINRIVTNIFYLIDNKETKKTK